MKRIITLAAALALLALSCGEEEGVTPQEPDRLEPTTPVNVLKNVEVAFNQRDINLLKAMLGANFVFYFDPGDVGGNPPGSKYVIPESWSYTEFWMAVNNMFRKAYSINLTISTGNVPEPPPEATEYETENVPTELLVMTDEFNGYIGDGYCDFELEKYTSESGKKYWRLIAWRDRGRYADEEFAATAPSTIGRVLAIYYMV